MTATGTATGVGGVNLSSDLTINSTHTNAESYSDTWSFTDPTGNYAPKTGAMTDTIGQATATIMVTPISGLVYNGSPQQTASYSATGVGGVSLPSTDFTILRCIPMLELTMTPGPSLIRTTSRRPAL